MTKYLSIRSREQIKTRKEHRINLICQSLNASKIESEKKLFLGLYDQFLSKAGVDHGK
jgi:hypothetical protein